MQFRLSLSNELVFTRAAVGLLALIVVQGALSAASAQFASGTLTGKVTTHDGQPVADA